MTSAWGFMNKIKEKNSNKLSFLEPRCITPIVRDVNEPFAQYNLFGAQPVSQIIKAPSSGGVDGKENEGRTTK